MQKVLSACAALLLVGNASLFAQVPSFTSADMPEINIVIEMSPLDSAATAALNIGTAGAGKTWDFSGFSPLPYPTNTYYVSPIQRPQSDQFPTATLASTEELTDSSEYTYFLLNSSEFSQLGTADPTTLLKFNPAFNLFKFPFTYLTKFNQSISASGVAEGFTLSGTVKNDVLADGSGTVKTPLGTFPCLRVKRIVEYNLSLFIFNVIERDTSYEWITKQYKNPVLRYTRYYSSAFGEVSTGAYADMLTAQTVATQAPASVANMDLQVTPNPFTGQTTLSFDLPKAGNVDMTVADATGQVVRKESLGFRTPGLQTVNLDLNDSPAGTYYVLLRQQGRVLTARPVVKS